MFEEATQTIVGPEANEQPYVLNHPIRNIIDVNQHRLLVRTADSFITIPRGDTHAQSSTKVSAQRSRYNQQTGEHIAWSEWELWLLSGQGGAELRNRTSAAMWEVLPLDSEGVLLLVTADTLLAFNPNPLYYTTHELYSGTPMRHVSVDVDKRLIYFVTTTDDVRGLYQLRY